VGRGQHHAAEYRKLTGLLKQARLDAGIAQAQLAETLGRPQSYVSKIELGVRLVDPVELRELCRALRLRLPDLLKDWERRLR
jgi:transcriptional regulator with XRE-family HTH domain